MDGKYYITYYLVSHLEFDKIFIFMQFNLVTKPQYKYKPTNVIGSIPSITTREHLTVYQPCDIGPMLVQVQLPVSITKL